MALISNGSTVFDAGSMASGFGGSMTFIKKLTASSSATLSFVDGSDGVVLDDTYKEYVFYCIDIHPSTNASLRFQVSTDGGSSYSTTTTSTIFRAYHNEAGTGTALAYDGGQAQGTSTQEIINAAIGTDNDQTGVCELKIFNPSSTTFVKHYTAVSNGLQFNDYTINSFTAGYFNTTSAVDAVQFSMSSGNIDAGDICLYGIA